MSPDCDSNKMLAEHVNFWQTACSINDEPPISARRSDIGWYRWYQQLLAIPIPHSAILWFAQIRRALLSRYCDRDRYQIGQRNRSRMSVFLSEQRAHMTAKVIWKERQADLLTFFQFRCEVLGDDNSTSFSSSVAWSSSSTKLRHRRRAPLIAPLPRRGDKSRHCQCHRRRFPFFFVQRSATKNTDRSSLL